MAQNNPVGTHIVTDGQFGSRVFLGNTSPSYPISGDFWIDNTQGSAPTANFTTYTATGGETSVTATYTPGYEMVFLNGAKLVRGSDYTATNGTSITALGALVASDVVDVYGLTTATATGSVPLSTITTAGDLIVGTGTSAATRLGVGTSGQVLTSNGTTPTYTSTLSGITENNLTLTGTLTAASSVGTSGQYLQTTTTGVQWATLSAVSNAKVYFMKG